MVTKFGYMRCNADHTPFVKRKNMTVVILVVYVHEIVVTRNDDTKNKKLKAYLRNDFEIKDLGSLKCFLGIEVARSKSCIVISQCKCTMDLLEETGKLGANPVDTAIEQNHGLHSHSGEPLHDKRANQRLVGKLIYLTITRPDISYDMSLVSQFMHAPRTEHLSAVHRILKYLKLGAKPVDTQIEQNHGLHSHNREPLHDKSMYQ